MALATSRCFFVEILFVWTVLAQEMHVDRVDRAELEPVTEMHVDRVDRVELEPVTVSNYTVVATEVKTVDGELLNIALMSFATGIVHNVCYSDQLDKHEILAHLF